MPRDAGMGRGWLWYDRNSGTAARRVVEMKCYGRNRKNPQFASPSKPPLRIPSAVPMPISTHLLLKAGVALPEVDLGARLGVGAGVEAEVLALDLDLSGAALGLEVLGSRAVAVVAGNVSECSFDVWTTCAPGLLVSAGAAVV